MKETTPIKMTLENRYYHALFTRNFELAKRIYRVPELQANWNAERLVKEGHKCGAYDEADKEIAQGPLSVPVCSEVIQDERKI